MAGRRHGTAGPLPFTTLGAVHGRGKMNKYIYKSMI
jgi:hypothetical protein